MRSMKVSLGFLGGLLLVAPAQAQLGSDGVLQQEIADIKEDLMVLQRQVYRTQSGDRAPGVVQMGQYDEMIRQTAGKVDELEYKIKSLEEKINLINKDVDVRLKMIEGKSLNNPGAEAAPIPEKFAAPVAKDAPKAVVGGSIAKGDDLPPVKTKSAAELYEAGQAALKAGNNAAAEENFNAILKKYPEDKLAGNAQYWLGESYYGRKDFKKAAVAFAKGYEQYKGGAKGADSLLKLGMSMRELGKKDEACVAFVNLPKEFPKAEAVLKEKAQTQAKAIGCK